MIFEWKFKNEEDGFDGNERRSKDAVRLEFRIISFLNSEIGTKIGAK